MLSLVHVHMDMGHSLGHLLVPLPLPNDNGCPILGPFKCTPIGWRYVLVITTFICNLIFKPLVFPSTCFVYFLLCNYC